MANISFFAPDTDAFVDSVIRHVGEYEAMTGDKVHLNIIGSDEFFANDIEKYLEMEGEADVFTSGPVLLWEHIDGGFIEPLDEYVAVDDSGFDFDDFIPNLIRANRWTGRFGDKLGNGPLLAIPVNCESYNMAYNKEIFEKEGLSLPKTWDEYFETAKKISSIDGLRGFAQRGTGAWHTVYTGFATQFWTMGCTDFSEEGRCMIASEKAVKVTQQFLDMLHEAGPENWTEQRWYELAMDFCDGKYGLIVDSDHYVGYYKNPKISRLAGKVGYAPTPVNEKNEACPNLWTWSVVMNARSTEKEAAWRFIKWVSGREFLLRSAFEGNMNPTRKSIWEDESFRRFSGAWGDFRKVSMKLAEEDGHVLVTPHVRYRLIAERWAEALLNAYVLGNTEEELQKAAKDIELIVSHEN